MIDLSLSFILMDSKDKVLPLVAYAISFFKCRRKIYTIDITVIHFSQ